MAINVYSGLQGSGKSYECMRSVVLEAIMAGRNVVTNVDGINEELIYGYLAKTRDADVSKLGKVVHVANARIAQPQFFPDEEKPHLESVVQAGDLVAVDEAWRFWGTDCGRLTHEHMQFFRMHRHYVHPQTGVACDVALMTQDISGLTRTVKNVVEFSFHMTKLKSLGLTQSYRVQVYDGWKQNRKTQIDVYNKRYDPAIFPLYKSYAGGGGNEQAIDKRSNVLANKKFWMIAAGSLCLMAIGAWNTWRFFHRQPAAATSTQSTMAAASTPQAVPAPSPASSLSLDRPNYSENWRITGRIEINRVAWVVLANASGRLRLESPSVFSNDRLAMVGMIDGQKITSWTANLPPSSPMDLRK
ncbi:zonular occludens toxin domain-containing protein [Jeongeupia chitinilytica]|uniref:Membrane protein n=1 Tax=Jeongeupia chitinilytica TaxID=1041641 RepID=A0ABQ3H1W7_9NEIS|nr:zonular occludens toxin domain-containing protein [Jeongeupia chitinilytica]GHD66079.1 membrane protein [Jeongeupia chitinilytica]